MISKHSVEKIKDIELKPSSHLKMAVWHVRTTLRDIFKGRDVLTSRDLHKKPARKSIRRIYKKADEFIQTYFPNFTKKVTKRVAMRRVRDMINEVGYTIVEMDEGKPWGAYYRLRSDEAKRFVSEFFPGLSMKEAQLGNNTTELSPKFLLVTPGQRLSWQLHHRRAERWRFLNKGAYFKSSTDKQGKRVTAEPDTIVQFEQGERHRLCTFDDESYTLVAEIWQHSDPQHPSDENDIVRLEDDYSRVSLPR